MLNLSDIRKKAKKEKKETPAKEGAPAKQARRAPAKASEAAGISDEERLASEDFAEEAIAPSAKRDSAPASPGGTADPLEALFRLGQELDLATEEAYFQGLVGGKREEDENLRQLLCFSLGQEEYVVDIGQVKEIVKLREITEIPRAPDFILGLISLRGAIIPIYDLMRRLKLGAIEPTPAARVVVCQHGQKIVGLLVEKINQVVRIPEQGIEPTPGILSGLDRDMVEGVGRHQGRMLILLDLASVFDAELI